MFVLRLSVIPMQNSSNSEFRRRADASVVLAPSGSFLWIVLLGLVLSTGVACLFTSVLNLEHERVDSPRRGASVCVRRYSVREVLETSVGGASAYSWRCQLYTHHAFRRTDVDMCVERLSQRDSVIILRVILFAYFGSSLG